MNEDALSMQKSWGDIWSSAVSFGSYSTPIKLAGHMH